MNLKFLYRAYRYKYTLDKAEINYLTKHIVTGDTVVDIGAHKGGYLYWMKEAVGTYGKVYAFEPQPILYDYLTKIKKQFGWKNVTIENKGVSDEVGTLDFFIPKTKKKTSPGARFSVDAKHAHKFDDIKVETIRLDDYFEDYRPIKLLKIDVEGHEINVLKGAEKLLKRARPRIIMECEQRHLRGTSVYNVFLFLELLGYKGQFICKNKLLPISEFDLDTHQDVSEGGAYWEAEGYCNNFLFEYDPDR